MFDFEKLHAYSKAKEFLLGINREVLADPGILKHTKDQLRRASLSIVLNIAESTSRFSDADKRHFYIVARGSLIECIACLDIMKDDSKLNDTIYHMLYSKGEALSRILYALIKGLDKK